MDRREIMGPCVVLTPETNRQVEQVEGLPFTDEQIGTEWEGRKEKVKILFYQLCPSVGSNHTFNGVQI